MVSCCEVSRFLVFSNSCSEACVERACIWRSEVKRSCSGELPVYARHRPTEAAASTTTINAPAASATGCAPMRLRTLVLGSSDPTAMLLQTAPGPEGSLPGAPGGLFRGVVIEPVGGMVLQLLGLDIFAVGAAVTGMLSLVAVGQDHVVAD